MERLSTQNEILQKQLVCHHLDSHVLMPQVTQEIRSHELWPLQEVRRVTVEKLTIQGAGDAGKDDPYVSPTR